MNRVPALLLTLVALAAGRADAGDHEEDLAFDVATEAYVYAYPMMLMEITRRVSTNVESPVGMFAPMNRFAHMRAFPDHTFREVIRPNVDTLYSIVWFDVSREPLVLSIPKGTKRYHMMPMLDMWTDVFACPGTRTSGADGGNFAILGPGWKGALPAGVEGIRSPTSVGWIIGRTQTNGKSDYEAARAIQDGYAVTPLSRFGQPAASPVPGKVDGSWDTKTPPPVQVARMSAKEYFELFSRLLVPNPPHEVDWPILARMRRIGFVPGQPLDFAALDASVRDGLERGAKRGQELIALQARRGGAMVNGWVVPLAGMGSYGAAYLQRAAVALIGLGANLVEDAVYPMSAADAQGEPYDGKHTYRIHFPADALPPVGGFWSLTMYENGYLVDNPIGRYAIGDRDELSFNEDGSLDLLLQHEPPPEDRRANWLPAPSGAFDLVLRLYWPRTEVLTGQWVPPPVTRIATGQ